MKKILCVLMGILTVWSLPALAEMPYSFAPLVKKASPAVVNIYAKRVVHERVVSPLFNDPFFNQFFNAPGVLGPARDRLEKSLGSGVIVDDDGMVATNHHVIKDATEISVVTADGREFSAEKVLDDPRTDLAILKINAKGEKLAELDLADSDDVEVGDVVLAIGNPFGVGQTVTSGIVSAVARTDVGISDYGFFIQTDAAINPGNSGGALVDTKGRLIGINSAIYSKDGGSLGIGFAIPANMLKTIIDAAAHGSTVVRAWTGMTGQTITSDMIENLKLKKAQGSLINQVYKGGPADKAGLKVGDVILAINGKEVQDPVALKYRLGTVSLGSDINLQVSRGGSLFEATMKAVAPPEKPPRQETLIKGGNPFAGAIVANINPALAEEMGRLPLDSGVIIFKLSGGTAARLGIARGDVILSINGDKVTSVDKLKDILGDASVNRWQIQLRRGTQTINITVSG